VDAMSREIVSLKTLYQLASSLHVWQVRIGSEVCQSLTPMKETGKMAELLKENITVGV
jgi:hypothetical protein